MLRAARAMPPGMAPNQPSAANMSWLLRPWRAASLRRDPLDETSGVLRVHRVMEQVFGPAT
jgi:hypothetical protein